MQTAPAQTLRDHPSVVGMYCSPIECAAANCVTVSILCIPCQGLVSSAPPSSIGQDKSLRQDAAGRAVGNQVNMHAQHQGEALHQV